MNNDSNGIKAAGGTAGDIIASQQEKVDAMFEINYLTPENAEFAPTDGGFVSMKHGGEDYPRVQFYRAFPFTQPDIYISVRKGDGNESREIGMIENLSVFPEEVRALVEKQLGLRYFMPVITKIIDIRQEYGYSYWDTVTDRGECRFTVQVGSGTVNRLGDSRLIISDINANRFEITDFTKLSAAELKKLDLYL